VRLGPDELAGIEAAVPEALVAGTRYDERQMKMLDSEVRANKSNPAGT
jgi:hypothetical protein